ncbi:MAG: DUF975 family protein [Candidatus Izemoplasmataceae bacterium]
MTRKSLKAQAKKLFRNQYDVTLLTVFLTLVISIGAGSVIPLAGAILILPIYIGRSRVFLDIARGKKGNIDSLLETFKTDYAEKVLTLFLKNLFLFLWFLLLIVPVVVKSMSYALVPYIMAEEDFDPKKEKAIDISRQMMDGYKKELFVIYLSFIGWYILGALTLGILTILYVEPYVQQTRALFYEKVKAETTALDHRAQPMLEE